MPRTPRKDQAAKTKAASAKTVTPLTGELLPPEKQEAVRRSGRSRKISEDRAAPMRAAESRPADKDVLPAEDEMSSVLFSSSGAGRSESSDEADIYEGELLEAEEAALEEDDAGMGGFGSEEDGYPCLTARDDDSGDLPVPVGNRLPATRSRDSLQAYIQQCSRFPLLEPEEEHELAVRFRDSGDKEAGAKIVRSHLRLVVKIAMEFQRRWMQNVLDLIQEGNTGLLHALHKFDPDKGIKFSYYSAFWIRAYILKFIMDNFRLVKLGTTQTQRKLFFNLNKERQKLIAQGFTPDAEMLSRKLGVDKDDVLEMEQRLSSSDVSLNVPVSDESGSAMRMDFLPALGEGVEESIAREEMRAVVMQRLQKILPRLSEKERYILEHRSYTDDEETLRKIGERYGITRERVRQLETRLLEKIRKYISSGIKDFSEDWIRQ